MLLVDDEPTNIEVLARSLELKGHRGTGAGSADAAAMALASASFDLVMLDHVLPGATGMQSLGRLRALTKAPIFIMSGYTDDDTRKDAMLLGASGFLPKPIDLAAIFEVLESIPEKI